MQGAQVLRNEAYNEVRCNKHPAKAGERRRMKRNTADERFSSAC
jgi:hypothetical protein